MGKGVLWQCVQGSQDRAIISAVLDQGNCLPVSPAGEMKREGWAHAHQACQHLGPAPTELLGSCDFNSGKTDVFQNTETKSSGEQNQQPAYTPCQHGPPPGGAPSPAQVGGWCLGVAHGSGGWEREHTVSSGRRPLWVESGHLQHLCLSADQRLRVEVVQPGPSRCGSHRGCLSQVSPSPPFFFLLIFSAAVSPPPEGHSSAV